MRRVRSIRLKFLTKSHERKREREGKSMSSHQDVESNADETSSRLARVIDDEEERKKEKERKEGRN